MRKLLAAAVLIASAVPALAQTTLKFGHYADVAHPGHEAAVQFATNVEKRTNGQIKIQVFPANQLGSPPELLQQTKLGVIDFAFPTQGQLDKFEKAFAAVMMPFAFANLAEAHKALDGPVMDWLSPLAEKQGFKLLGQLGMGLPPHHQLEGRRQRPGQCERPEDPRPAGSAARGDDGSARRAGHQDRVPGTLSRPLARRGRRPGESRSP